MVSVDGMRLGVNRPDERASRYAINLAAVAGHPPTPPQRERETERETQRETERGGEQRRAGERDELRRRRW